MKALDFTGKNSKTKGARQIAVIDCETDPFAPYRHIEPFAWGFFDGITYEYFTGADCTEKLISFLQSLPNTYQIFAHNGGRFDFMFILKHLRGEPLIINGRIVDADLFHHRLSDSYARIPVPLARFGQKTEIDYNKLERSARHKHMPEILAYLEQDCVALYNVITAWHERFGGKSSTMASAAFKECQKRMGKIITPRMSPGEDDQFRSFYFGGRVQAFSIGVIQDNVSIHDVNSMYPHVMCEYQHPIGTKTDWRFSTDIDDDTDFACVWAWSKGALPLRTATGLTFPVGYGKFFASIHEIKAGLKFRRLKIDRVVYAQSCRSKTDFSQFIRPIYAERLAARDRGDIMGQEFSKQLMNSCYGKFAINPRKFRSYCMIGSDEVSQYETILTVNGLELKWGEHWYHLDEMPEDSSTPHMLRFSRANTDEETRKGFRNVACAASITAAARATLFEALCLADSPYYCDTDSIIAPKLEGIATGAMRLGDWKLEATGNEIAIGGKKMYAVFGDMPNDNAKIAARIKLYGDARCIKLASKGVRMSADQMRSVASGASVSIPIAQPQFNASGSQIIGRHRRIEITNKDQAKGFPMELTRADIHGKLERLGCVA
jgi:hypothetical protein